ncbi:MAG: cell filamentation protein Fic [Sphingomonadales bacterium 35-56-22]|jgi:Fic-DOC domain mobile mystery protein B|uniref:mobile mystery protein B n=1 Tax=Sphingorhabdus sp. TaxID=1902408 RepID=UPI000BD66F6A|nr:mobile mystery protein B [Sphingorhabdus sp.]MCE2730298.1 mobile mystery protein B [Sphingomonadaceae bacterium]OYY14935.1 MAG: cell filamentation protein Fic [Sphingomonadales bacterium 35-56-22]OYY97261.1 MAG: cell filamentation protein Fic [Sphingomonadales bacterium 28-56-43]OYZ60065.1 MAG: cell filamentation protein Fic [Sphingomonadales bacterium 24-56-14]OZA82344.1 MAG: cell filamentation protein Fic [Sphingomonadales bacterium 39-57-19]
MTDALFHEDDDANTPLDAEEMQQLIPSYITLRRELNEAEQVNIAHASKWLSSRRSDPLDEVFLRELHRRMFGQVWRWAGHYRKTARNIGVDANRVRMDTAQALDDARFWVANATYAPDEIAVRFSHRLVAIHPFPNGNGRLSRMAGDLLAVQLGRPQFSWGSHSLTDANVTRAAYIAALRAADAHDLGPLILFARS